MQAGKRIPRVFKSEGREFIKVKNRLLEGGIYEIPNELVLEKDIAGCVGSVLPGTMVRLSTSRTTPVGKLYFFDGFKFDRYKNLEWVGEFDTLRIEKVAKACGKEILPEHYKKMLIPDEDGILHETVGSMVEEHENG